MYIYIHIHVDDRKIYFTNFPNTENSWLLISGKIRRDREETGNRRDVRLQRNEKFVNAPNLDRKLKHPSYPR